jgi:Protein of unknown function (DUF2905)
MDCGKDSTDSTKSLVHAGRARRDWAWAMIEFGKVLIFFGVILVVAGIAVLALGRMNVPLGRLPGDFLYRGKNTTVYFPLATSVVVSVVLSVLLYLVGRWRR